MAAPRIFVSSTCYDFQETRENLRDFIKSFGYEPVMSEFGDIFYEFNKHVQDACLVEIEKCQMFILIVGNSYGTIYHKTPEGVKIPDSVTLQEFKKALSIDMPKFTFLNKFVHYDYSNYRRQLDNRLTEVFSGKEVPEDKIQSTIHETRIDFDEKYSFPKDAYRYIFHFIDIIEELKVNNATFQFETVTEIKEQLKKQWAGFLYERLTKPNIVSTSTVANILKKLDRINDTLKNFLVEKIEDAGKLTFSVSKIASSLVDDMLEETQNLLDECMGDIKWFFDPYSHEDKPRGYLHDELTHIEILGWLCDLESLLKTYKWSSTITFDVLWKDFNCTWWKNRAKIPYKSILKLYGLFNSVPEEEKEAFAKTILMKLSNIIKIEKKDDGLPPDDDLPF